MDHMHRIYDSFWASLREGYNQHIRVEGDDLIPADTPSTRTSGEESRNVQSSTEMRRVNRHNVEAEGTELLPLNTPSTPTSEQEPPKDTPILNIGRTAEVASTSQHAQSINPEPPTQKYVGYVFDKPNYEIFKDLEEKINALKAQSKDVYPRIDGVTNFMTSQTVILATIAGSMSYLMLRHSSSVLQSVLLILLIGPLLFVTLYSMMRYLMVDRDFRVVERSHGERVQDLHIFLEGHRTVPLPEKVEENKYTVRRCHVEALMQKTHAISDLKLARNYLVVLMILSFINIVLLVSGVYKSGGSSTEAGAPSPAPGNRTFSL